MLPKKIRHLLYAVLLLALFVVGTSAIANTKVYEFLSVVTTEKDHSSAISLKENTEAKSSNRTSSLDLEGASESAAPMFMTIIQGADEEVTCPNDGSTLAKFFLCGTSDIRNGFWVAFIL